MNKEEKIIQLREELKHGRISEASTTFDANTRNTDTASRGDFQATEREVKQLSRTGGRTESINGEPRRDERSVEKKPIGIRQPNRRHGEDHSRPDAVSTTTGLNTVGRLETDEKSPERKIEPDKPDPQFVREHTPGQIAKQYKLDRKAAKSIKDKQAYQDKKDGIGKDQRATIGDQINKTADKILPTGKTLSATEAKEYTESLPSALGDYFGYFDEYLWLRKRGIDADYNRNEPIWSDVDKEELEALTRVLVKRGQTNAGAATVVRGLVEAKDYAAVISIFAPRIVLTVGVIRETRKPRKGRMQQ